MTVHGEITPRSPHLDVDALLDDRSIKVIVCCGSGGVGKTTTAAALGLRAADRGRDPIHRRSVAPNPDRWIGSSTKWKEAAARTTVITRAMAPGIHPVSTRTRAGRAAVTSTHTGQCHR